MKPINYIFCTHYFVKYIIIFLHYCHVCNWWWLVDCYIPCLWVRWVSDVSSYVLCASGLSVITTKLKAKKMFAQLPCCYLTFYKTSYLKTLQMSGRYITIHNFRALKSVLSVVPTLHVITNFLHFRKAGKLITILLLFPNQ